MDIPLARTRFDLFATFALIVYAVVATALVAAAIALLDGTTELVVLIVLVVLWVCHSGIYLFGWSRMRKVSHPLGLHPDGLHARSQVGEAAVPWEAIESVRVERAWNGRLLRIRLVPPADSRYAGVTLPDNPALVKAIGSRGMRFSLRVLDVDLETLRQAFTVQSAGRVHVG